MQDFAGRVALVTGAASGMGAATARPVFAERGSSVMLADRNAALGEQVAEEIQGEWRNR